MAANLTSERIWYSFHSRFRLIFLPYEIKIDLIKQIHSSNYTPKLSSKTKINNSENKKVVLPGDFETDRATPELFQNLKAYKKVVLHKFCTYFYITMFLTYIPFYNKDS